MPTIFNRITTGAAMKTMNCKQLGGACEQLFHAETFEEMAELSKQHAMEMLQRKDPAHLEAMNRMQKLMQDSAAMKAWFDARKNEFNSLETD